MRKIILLFIIVVSVVIYVNLPLFRDAPRFKTKAEIAREIEDREVVGEPINSREINSFLEVWPQYTASWVSRVGSMQMSLTRTDTPSKRVPYIVKAWLIRKGWEVDRFFYVEQRLKSIVKSIEIGDRSAATIDLLNMQYKIEKDEKRKEVIKKEIEYQSKLKNIEKVSRVEREMVRPHIKEISDMILEKASN